MKRSDWAKKFNKTQMGIKITVNLDKLKTSLYDQRKINQSQKDLVRNFLLTKFVLQSILMSCSVKYVV